MKQRNLEPTSIKIPTGLLEMIDNDIEMNQDFRNRSEWIIAAIRAFEKERIKLIIERKAAFMEEDYVSTPSRSLQTRDDGVKDS